MSAGAFSFLGVLVQVDAECVGDQVGTLGADRVEELREPLLVIIRGVVHTVGVPAQVDRGPPLRGLTGTSACTWPVRLRRS